MAGKNPINWWLISIALLCVFVALLIAGSAQ